MPQTGTGAIANEQVGVPTAHVMCPLEQNGAASGPPLLDDEDDELLTGAPLELELDELLEELLEELMQPTSPGKNAPKGLEVLQPGVFTPDITTHPGAPVKPLVQAGVPMLHIANMPEQVTEPPLLLEEELDEEELEEELLELEEELDEEELLAAAPLELEEELDEEELDEEELDEEELDEEELDEEELMQPASPGKNAPKGLEVLQPGVFTPDITTHPGAPTLPFIQAAVPMLHTTNIPEQVIELPLLLEEELDEEELLAAVPLELELEELLERLTQVASPGKNAPKGVEVLQPGVFTPDITTHPGAPVKPLVQTAVKLLGQTVSFPLHVGETALLGNGKSNCKANVNIKINVENLFKKLFNSFFCPMLI